MVASASAFHPSSASGLSPGVGFGALAGRHQASEMGAMRTGADGPELWAEASSRMGAMLRSPYVSTSKRPGPRKLRLCPSVKSTARSRPISISCCASRSHLRCYPLADPAGGAERPTQAGAPALQAKFGPSVASGVPCSERKPARSALMLTQNAVAGAAGGWTSTRRKGLTDQGPGRGGGVGGTPSRLPRRYRLGPGPSLNNVRRMALD